MKKIKICFADMPKEFDLSNNYILDILREKYEIEVSQTPDFLFYSCFGFENFRFEKCVKIFVCGEPVIPNFNDCDYAVGYVYLTFGERYHRAAYAFASGEGNEVPEEIQDRSDVSKEMAERKFCNFIYSNDVHGEGALLRTEFCKKMSRYKKVDCPGLVLHNMDANMPRYVTNTEGKYGVFSNEWQHGKREFQAGYKFSIAFESTLLPGMTSDKIMDPLYAKSVPIYWGNPNIDREVNPKAFINCHDYNGDWDAVIERVKELDRDPAQYLEILRSPPMCNNYDFHQRKHLAEFLYQIIEHGNAPVRSCIATETFPAISAYSISTKIPHVDEEDTVQAIIDYHSDTHKLVKRIQKFGTTPLGRVFKRVFKYGVGVYRSVRPDR